MFVRLHEQLGVARTDDADAPETNPRLVFKRLFGDIDTSVSSETRARRLVHRRSILDLVSARTSELMADLRPSDPRKLDEYLSSIRETEMRIAKYERDLTGLTPGIDKPTGVPVEYADYVNLMFDLQLVTFQTDSTRIVTMVMGPEWIEKVTTVNTMHMELFAGFVKKMKATPDGDGSLLDHSMIVYGSGLSDGNRHTHNDRPSSPSDAAVT